MSAYCIRETRTFIDGRSIVRFVAAQDGEVRTFDTHFEAADWLEEFAHDDRFALGVGERAYPRYKIVKF